MKAKFLFLTLFFVTFFCVFSNAQILSGIKVVSGKTDTVYRATHYVVGAVSPGSEVLINGTVVKQYKTGSFGIELKLVEGVNPIEIRVKNNKEDLLEKFSVYYKLQQPKPVISDTNSYHGMVVTTLPEHI